MDALKQQIQTNVTAMNFRMYFLPDGRKSADRTTDLPELQAKIYTDPVNATLDPDNGYSVGIENGTSMNADNAKAEYESAEENTDITIPFTFTEPEITTEKMNANLFKDTHEVTAPAQRWNERKNSQRRTYGIYMQRTDCSPGETFSFNGVVGDTTAEKGYQEAAGYQDGKVVQVLGRRRMPGVLHTVFRYLYTDLDVVEKSQPFDAGTLCAVWNGCNCILGFTGFQI